MQTAYIVVKEKFRKIFYGDFKYDKRETFTFKDGGKIYLDYKGTSFIENVSKI
jgi:hypothetical protein